MNSLLEINLCVQNRYPLLTNLFILITLNLFGFFSFSLDDIFFIYYMY